MATHKISGIVLKILDYDDHDQIITLLCRDDIIAFIARGVRKINSKNRVALQLGNLIEAEIFKSRLKTKLSKLKKAVILKQIPIKENDTASILLYLLKIFKSIKKPSEIFFSAYISIFNSWGKDNQHIKVYLLFHFLDTLGRYPVMDRCVECGRNDNISGFEFYKGGYTCNLHTKKHRSLNFLKAIKDLELGWSKYLKTSNSVNFEIFELLKPEYQLNYLRL